jgi:hypothetical protein
MSECERERVLVGVNLEELRVTTTLRLLRHPLLPLLRKQGPPLVALLLEKIALQPPDI